LDSMEMREALLSFSKATVLLELARKRLERETGLVERKISTQQDLLDAEERHEGAKIEHEVALKRLALLGVEEPRSLEAVSELNSKRPLLSVRSPLDGVVMEAHVIPGELITPDKELVTVADLSDVWLWIDIYEHDISAVLDGKRRGSLGACVRTGAFPGRDFSGTVDYIADSVSEETRTVKARVTLANAEGLLRPGMFVSCDVLLPGAEPRLLIPRDALLRDEGVTFVFKELNPGMFVRQGILAGKSHETEVEVLGGLSEGERVVARGAFILKSEVLREKLGAG
ncbi:MAG: efflux RND transporter periplasmic adaptor subunit, partial [Planctomycetota bacterium]|nr:efflux RND transporter periplasmic adaptor subunit [Planctomycetota bacterium]